MPAFNDYLSNEEVMAMVAYIKTKFGGGVNPH
jgi:mono/diheme cytochrome c family protein